MLKPTRYDLYEKALNRQPKKKAMDKDKILIKIFQDWRKSRYTRVKGGWESTSFIDDIRTYTTRELWELYQQFLGKKG